MERFARRWWAGELGWRGTALRVATAPLSWGWQAAVAARGRAASHDPPRRVEGVRVVSVGNLAVGGTGKTPVAAWIADRLEERGLATAIVVGGAAADEAALQRRWRPERVVLVDRDRTRATERAKEEGARAVVLDDAFQHRRPARDLDVVLLSADDPFPGPLLPRGPYREPARALARADAVVVTRRDATPEAARGVAERAAEHAPGRVVAGAALTPAGWLRLGDPRSATLQPGPVEVLAVCGVARADAFRRAATRSGVAAAELVAFADHHAYGPADVVRLNERAAGRPIGMTEKDAVKLERWKEELGEAWVLMEELRWDWGETQLVDRLASRAGAR